MGLINKTMAGVESLSEKAGAKVFEKAMMKNGLNVEGKVLGNMSKEFTENLTDEFVQTVSSKAVSQADYAYRMARMGAYGAMAGGAVGLVNNTIGNGNDGSLRGAGLGAISGASAGAVAAAIAKGIR